MAENQQGRTKVFISYSHQDLDWLKRLRVHLKPLERQYGVEIWSDTDIQPGMRWRDEIGKALASAKVAVLLVSADFIASDFVDKHELPPLLRAAETDGAVVLPLILSPSMFNRIDELSRFEAVNDPSRPLVDLPRGEQEAALVRLTEVVGNALGYPGEEESRERARAVASPQPAYGSADVARGERGQSEEKESPGPLKVSPAIWVALITGLVTIVAAYIQFGPKPERTQESQEAAYTGRVTDARTQKPIHRAKVTIEEGQNIPQIQSTDSEGIFRIVLRGSTNSARIIVEAPGYVAFDRNVSFSRTGVEPIGLDPADLTPTPAPTATTMPTPRVAVRPTPLPPITTRRKKRKCTPEEILLGKCSAGTCSC
jgi:hypothetical protein